MIKCGEGKIIIEGEKERILSELSIIAKSLYKHCDFSKKEIFLAIELGILTKEQKSNIINSIYGINGKLDDKEKMYIENDVLSVKEAL